MPSLSPAPALYYGLLAFCLLLGFGLLVLAWRRPRQRQRPLRMLAGAVVAASLWLTAFPPVRQLPATRAESILLTEGYAPDTLRQLLRQLGAGTPVWAYGNVEKAAKARPLASLLTLAEQRPALRRLHVLGTGLPAADLPILGNVAVRQHSDTPGAGFQTAYWPAQLPLGEVLQIEGAVSRPKGAGPAWVVLQAAGAGRDSVQLAANGTEAFRLHYQPKTAGLATYELVLRRPGQPPLREPVPVEIITAALPAVLLLTATPSFEFKFLKNHLAEAHYPVALRTSVSRGLVQTDFVNQPRAALDRLTPALLARYAVVVADAATVASLTGAETQALQTAVRNGRLGLITLAEAAPLPRNAPARTDFAVLPRPATPASLPALAWPAAPGEARAPLPAQLQPRPNLQPLISGPQQAIAAARQRLGLGAVVVSVVPETFRWGLQGHPAVYASFWNRLLRAVVPPAAPVAAWQTGTRWPRPGQPLTLRLAAATLPAELPTVAALAGGPAVPLALRQDSRLPEWSTARFWPGVAGWHRANGPGRVSFSFYVYPATAWQGPELAARRQAAAQLATAAPAATTAEGAQDFVSEPWPAGWFFGLFLLAAGYLWLEEKL
ncbi:hypothetical protein MON38_06835 [Hymenobacter sp. DH14]|uniref:Aerotolerance regulator N-terminal domain-containing protein n=1 Tax=Hymenobacter cyanobacteriorum TaxID=2926463 RepID=A0A9X1VHR0_9BACT|nr:hypothetical protein [Hymenobacter cyanobacteriorum]MCI1187130.1 hypothetical protein [Hymenobacter cyanobacteriorum]